MVRRARSHGYPCPLLGSAAQLAGRPPPQGCASAARMGIKVPPCTRKESSTAGAHKGLSPSLVSCSSLQAAAVAAGEQVYRPLGTLLISLDLFPRETNACPWKEQLPAVPPNITVFGLRTSQPYQLPGH